MTEQEIEQEIHARIEFKMNEFLTALKNRVAIKYGQAWDMTHKSQYIWQAFEEVSQMVNKEVNMGTPCDEMAKRKKWKAKEIAVNKIVETCNLRGRDYDRTIRSIVEAIETSQDWQN